MDLAEGVEIETEVGLDGTFTVTLDPVDAAGAATTFATGDDPPFVTVLLEVDTEADVGAVTATFDWPKRPEGTLEMRHVEPKRLDGSTYAWEKRHRGAVPGFDGTGVLLIMLVVPSDATSIDLKVDLDAPGRKGPRWRSATTKARLEVHAMNRDKDPKKGYPAADVDVPVLAID